MENFRATYSAKKIGCLWRGFWWIWGGKSMTINEKQWNSRKINKKINTKSMFFASMCITCQFWWTLCVFIILLHDFAHILKDFQWFCSFCDGFGMENQWKAIENQWKSVDAARSEAPQRFISGVLHFLLLNYVSIKNSIISWTINT